MIGQHVGTSRVRPVAGVLAVEQADGVPVEGGGTERASEGPRRIQRRRIKGWRMPKGAVNVTRPSDWSNPWRVGDVVKVVGDAWRKDRVRGVVITPELACALFRAWTAGMEGQIKAELEGKNLVCWCPPGQPCHADILLEIANGWAS